MVIIYGKTKVSLNWQQKVMDEWGLLTEAFLSVVDVIKFMSIHSIDFVLGAIRKERVIFFTI